jgi:hypothetical protein
MLMMMGQMGGAMGPGPGPGAALGSWQGLTLVHFSAQLEPCLSQENTLHTLRIP